jgi:Cft2 family RNA processing exonuclease
MMIIISQKMIIINILVIYKTENCLGSAYVSIGVFHSKYEIVYSVRLSSSLSS